MKSTLKIVLASMLLVSCSASQIETTKEVGKKAIDISKRVLPVIAKVTLAYGAPYANVLQAFTEAVIPGYSAEYEAECSYHRSNYNENSEQYPEDGNYNEPPQEDNYDEQYSEEQYSEDEYSDDDQYTSEENYDYRPPNCYPADYYDERSNRNRSYDENYSEADYYEDEQQQNRQVAKLLAQVDVIREEYRDGQFIGTSVRDGDTLNANDNYKVQIGCNTDCFVYIAQLDSSGKMDPIMPSSLVNIENPLRGNTLHSLPKDNNWFFLDQNKGVETIYFIISQQPREDIELIFNQFESANKNLQPLQNTTIDEPMVMTKGISGVRQGRSQQIRSSSGEEGTYISTMLSSIDAELVLTRWFNHE